MSQIATDQYLILDAEGGVDSNSRMHKVENYKCVKVTVVLADSFDGLLEFFGSDDDNIPDLSLPSTDTNQYAPIAMRDYDPAATVIGDDGIDGSQAPYNVDGTYVFEVNSNGNKHFGVKNSGGTQGTAKVFYKAYDQKTI